MFQLQIEAYRNDSVIHYLIQQAEVGEAMALAIKNVGGDNFTVGQSADVLCTYLLIMCIIPL